MFSYLTLLAAIALGTPPMVSPSLETDPVESLDDAADDPVVWVHPTDSSKSLILGTDKKAGLGVYNLVGKRTGFLPEGRLNNIDLRDGFKLADGKVVSLAAATRRNDGTVVFFSIDTAGNVARVPGTIATGLGDVYGVAMYRSSKTARLFVFVCDKDGAAIQYEITDGAAGVEGKTIRSFHIGSIAEGMSADDEQGFLFVSEEQVALWRYPAEPDDTSPRVAIDLPLPRGHFTPDAEGIALLKTGPGDGFVVLSSQGDSAYSVYRRRPPHEFVTSFTIGRTVDGAIDGVSDTDGIEICASPLGAGFPSGIMVVQDGDNDGQPQNFKVVRLEALREIIDRANGTRAKFK